MYFTEISPDEFRAFADKSPYRSFYQTPEIAALREKNGWTAYYFGVKAKSSSASVKPAKFSATSSASSAETSATNPSASAKTTAGKNSKTSPDAPELLAACLLVAKPAFLGKSVFYSPGGPLLDFENRELLLFFTKHLKKYLQSHNAYVLHIEPYFELLERDRDGLPVENGFNHEKSLENLKLAGFKKCKISDEPVYQFVLDLKNRSTEELLASFKRNTRNHIKKAEKQGVKIRELSRDELHIFKTITEKTSARRDFQDKPLSYYENMYDLFASSGEVKFILAEAEIPPETESAPESGESVSETKAGAFASKAKEPAPETKPKTQTTPLSAAMFMLYGDEIIYLFSGSDEKFMRDYNAQYLIQWHMIKFAAEHGFKKYNFYGISGLPDRNDKNYGIYDFKKGFGGRVVELLGAHELPISPLFYLHEFLRKLKP